MLHYCFHWWSSSLPEPSNWSIKSLYKKSSNEILSVQGRFFKQVQQRSMTPRPMRYPACQRYDWYESINKPATTTPSSPRRGGRTNTIEQTFLLWSPWIKVTTIFFLKFEFWVFLFCELLSFRHNVFWSYATGIEIIQPGKSFLKSSWNQNDLNHFFPSKIFSST